MLVARASQQEGQQEAATSSLDKSVVDKEPDDTLELLENPKANIDSHIILMNRLFKLAIDPKTTKDLDAKIIRASKAVSHVYSQTGKASVGKEEELRFSAIHFLGYVGLKARRCCYDKMYFAMRPCGNVGASWACEPSPRVRAEAVATIYKMSQVVEALPELKKVMNGGDASVMVQQKVDEVLYLYNKEHYGGSWTSDVYRARCSIMRAQGGSRVVQTAYPCN